MTFEEYRKQKDNNQPRSWTVTILMAIIVALAVITFGAFLLDMSANGLSFVNGAGAFAALSIAGYAGVCAIDGKRKTAREALFDILLFWPFI